MNPKKLMFPLLLLPFLFIACSGGSDNSTDFKTIGSFTMAQSCAEVMDYVQGYAERAQQYPEGVVSVDMAPTVAAGEVGSDDTAAEAPQEGSSDVGNLGNVVSSDIAFSDTGRGLLYTFDQAYNLQILRVDPVGEVAWLANKALGFVPQELVTLQVGAKFYAVIFGRSFYTWETQNQTVPESSKSVSSPDVLPYEEPKMVMVTLEVTQPHQPVELKREMMPGMFLEARVLLEQKMVLWVSSRHIRTAYATFSSDEVLPDKTTVTPQATQTAPMTACENIHLYQNDSMDARYSPSALATTTVSLLDLNQALLPVASQSILSPGWSTFVSANTQHLFLGQTILWDQTELYQLDILTTPASLRFSAAAQVPGRILNQFFVDEDDGVVRVFHHQGGGANCLDCAVPADVGVVEPSESVANFKAQSTLTVGNYLSTYRQRGSELILEGRAGPFEEDEVPYAARFMGKLGCVITFLQIDPLTCFDLSDSAQPRKMGELEIPGVSFHLEPVTQDLLLGIGQGPSGEVVANLFDVSDPSHPTLADQRTLNSEGSSAYSPVFWDYRALGVDAHQQHFAVPFFENKFGETSSSKAYVSLLSVDGKKLIELGQLSQTYDYQRIFFFTETLATLSYQDVKVFTRQALQEIATFMFSENP